MISSELLRFLRRYWGRLLLLLLLVWVYTGFRFRTPDREAIASFKAEGVALKTGYFARHGKQLHYAQVGDDTRLPLLVFIHGTPGSWADFKAIMKDGSLRARYRMVSVDRPGFGFSDFGEALPMQEQVVLLAALLEELRQGPLHSRYHPARWQSFPALQPRAARMPAVAGNGAFRPLNH